MELNTDHLPPPSQPALVGVSGGRDSVALLDWLVKNGWENVKVCHVNHGLRGKASDEDALFTSSLAQDYGLAFLSVKVDVAADAKRTNQSIETAARTARYDFFGKCATQLETPNLMLAHHADDQAETLLFNFLRGSHGWKGMAPISQRAGLHIFRPLLNTRRETITHYCTANTLKFREDETNAQPVATRNRIRSEVFPLIKEVLGQDPVPRFLKAKEEQNDLGQILDHYLDPQGRLYLPSVRLLPRAFQQQVIVNFLKSNQVPEMSTRLIERALELIEPTAAPKLNLPGGTYLRRKESRLFVQQDKNS